MQIETMLTLFSNVFCAKPPTDWKELSESVRT